jgi:hypothetical protein
LSITSTITGSTRFKCARALPDNDDERARMPRLFHKGDCVVSNANGQDAAQSIRLDECDFEFSGSQRLQLDLQDHVPADKQAGCITRSTDTAIPMIRLALRCLEKIPLQLTLVDSCWALFAFWNDRPARVYY